DDGSPPKLISPSFLLAIGVNLGFGMVFFMLITSMAVYAATEFSAGESAAGFAASAFVVGALLARIFAGKYADLMGRRRTVVLSLVLFVLCSAAYLVVDDYAALIVLRIVHGTGLGFGQTALNAGVFSLIPHTRRGEGAGYYMIANSLPQALGPLVGLQLSHIYGFSTVFIGAAVISALALVLAAMVRLPEARLRRQRLRSALRLRPGDIIDRRAFPIALIALLTSAAFGSVMTFLDSFAQLEDMGNVASLYFLVFAGAVLITRLFVGRIQDRFGDNAAVYPAIVVFVGSLGLLAWSPNEAVVLVSAVLAGFGHGSLLPVLQAIIASAVTAPRVSIGISTFFILSDTGFGLSPLALGPLADAGGYRLMFAVCAGLILLSLGVYWFLHGRFDVKQGAARRPKT
ncbi:MAG: MFS transporter, partial [Nesterenkonia sp.]